MRWGPVIDMIHLINPGQTQPIQNWNEDRFRYIFELIRLRISTGSKSKKAVVLFPVCTTKLWRAAKHWMSVSKLLSWCNVALLLFQHNLNSFHFTLSVGSLYLKLIDWACCQILLRQLILLSNNQRQKNYHHCGGKLLWQTLSNAKFHNIKTTVSSSERLTPINLIDKSGGKAEIFQQ